jgi:hypothetical protein
LILLGWLIKLFLLMLAFILLFDGVRANVLGDEKSLVIFFILCCLPWSHLILLILGHKTHLWMIWRSKYIFVLGFSCQLWGENLTLDVTVWPNI